MTPVELTGQLFCADEDDLALVKRLLPDHIRLTRAEPGCIFFDVSQNDDPLVWEVRERFECPAAFDAHQHRARNSDWGKATRNLRRNFMISGR